MSKWALFELRESQDVFERGRVGIAKYNSLKLPLLKNITLLFSDVYATTACLAETYQVPIPVQKSRGMYGCSLRVP